MTLKFSDISAPTPTPESLAATYAAINARLDAGDLAGAVADWETARRACEDWGSLTHLRFEQDTADAARKAAMDYKDEISPSITNHETAFKQRLLAHPDRQAVEKAAGAYALRLWESDVTTFKPEIEPDLQEEAKLQSRYTALLSSAKIIFDGKETNLSGLGPYAQSLERDVRHRAAQARWGFFAENAAEFDEIYDSLVKVRARIAHKLGYESFTELGYRRMRRTDYNEADVASYRAQVLQHVTPLLAKFFEQRRRDEGWDKFYAWDEPVIDPKGNVEPAGDETFLRGQAQKMFEAMDGRLADFYRKMNEDGFMDLDNRPAKAPGGFCTSFPTPGMPFIF
ncbi:MAG TPA: M3 family metallopeptidase, partial [Acidocella sp.]|nr:M3 family metallopeptidase [Acidocella sp.]